MFYDLSTGIDPVHPRAAVTPTDDVAAGQDLRDDIARPVYWGAETSRSLAEFEAGGVRLSAAPHLIEATALICDATARSGGGEGQPTGSPPAAVGRACREIVAGALRSQFVVDVCRPGALADVQSNVMEVAESRARELSAADHHGLGPLPTPRARPDLFPATVRLAAHLALRDLQVAVAALGTALLGRAATLTDAEDTEDAVRVALRRRLTGYADGLAEHTVALALVCEQTGRLPGIDARTAAELSAVAATPISTTATAGADLLIVSAALKPIALRLAQLWSGLSVLGSAFEETGASRPEMITRTALDVIAAGLQDEVSAATGHGIDTDMTILLSLLTSIGKLRVSADSIAAWCEAPARPAARTLAA